MKFGIEEKYQPSIAETRWAAYWEEQGIYRFKPSSGKPIFSVDTPPPYASASHLHAGHAMSYTQADIVIRQRRMCGQEVFYPMGFDDNGLPTERFVEAKYNVDKSKISRPDFIELCLKETKIVTETYRSFWRMLGLSVDWSLEYSTIQPAAVRTAQHSFRDLWNKSIVAREEVPVMWDTSLQSALSQADVEVIERNGQLNYLAFRHEDGQELLVATTRPELVPACVALFCHPADARFVHLIGRKAHVPIFNYSVPMLADESVDPKFGTGLMMVCTFGDSEDVLKWRKHHLETRVILQEDGRLNERAKPFDGLSIGEARKAIITRLRDAGALKKQEQIVQRVTIGERSKTPVEFVPRLQWFLKMIDHKQELLRRGDELQWFPPQFKVRYEEWVNGLKWDWCLSRQRFYGVPIPAWFCTACGEPLIAKASEMPVDPTVTSPSVEACPHCGNREFRPDGDVFDTWMTSSLTPMINGQYRLTDDGQWIAGRDGLFPMSIRVQGFEIIRTWLFYTIVKSHFHLNKLPWHDAMISGWGLDPKGAKISKSVGNYEDPGAIVRSHSADALRYWAAKGTLGQNLRYDPVEVKSGQRLVTKLFNSVRFLAMNLGDDFRRAGRTFQPLAADRYILAKANEAIRLSTSSFNSFDYASARQVAETLFWNTYCDNYLEMVKYRMRRFHQRIGDSAVIYSEDEIIAGQCVAFDILLCCLKLLAPIIPFVTEHLYQGFFRPALDESAPSSIHISSWPEPFDGESVVDLADGEHLESALHNIRAQKALMKLGATASVDRVTIVAPSAVVDACRGLEREVASAVRANEVIFEAGVVSSVNISLL